jgi:hypothetical protein
LRVAEQRRGDAESLAHAQRELPGSLTCDGRQSYQVEQLVDSRTRNVIGLREHRQVRSRAASRMDGLGL